ncbi:hypothetical protein JCM11641_004421 [Rhodosporidiobolus odoratus]
MLLSNLLTPLALLATAVISASAAKTQSNDLIEINAAFPKSNPFASVTNGLSTNLLNLRLHNHGTDQVVVTGIRGEFREVGGKERVIRQTTAIQLRQPVPGMQKSPIMPYKFFSENKIGEVGLRVTVDYLDAGNKPHSYVAFDDVVNVIEPPARWFDFELLSVYAILLSLLSGAGYLVYTTHLSPPTTSPSRKRSSSSSSKNSTAAVATSDIFDGSTSEVEKKLDEGWIPEHHLKKRGGGGGGKGRK